MGFLRAAHMLTALPALRRAGAMAALPPAAAAGPGGRGLLLWGARPAARRPKSGGARCWWGQSGAGGLCCAWRWGSMRAVRGAAAWWWGSPPAAPGPHITCSYKLAARGAGLQAHGKDLCAPLMLCKLLSARRIIYIYIIITGYCQPLHHRLAPLGCTPCEGGRWGGGAPGFAMVNGETAIDPQTRNHTADTCGLLLCAA
jgi:hypothetical protein